MTDEFDLAELGVGGVDRRDDRPVRVGIRWCKILAAGLQEVLAVCSY